jgi:hypothetical protein
LPVELHHAATARGAVHGVRWVLLFLLGVSTLYTRTFYRLFRLSFFTFVSLSGISPLDHGISPLDHGIGLQGSENFSVVLAGVGKCGQ